MVLKKKLSKKLKRGANELSDVPTQKRLKKPSYVKKDEELLSDSDDEKDGEKEQEVELPPDSENPNETALEKKMRLTKQYLEEIRQLREEDESDDEKDFVGEKLKEEVLNKSGKKLRKMADSSTCPDVKALHTLKKFRKSVVALAVSNDGMLLFAASKDCAITKWCLKSFKQLAIVKGGKKVKTSHNDHILCLSLSTDMKFLVSGGADKVIIVWNPETMKKLHMFKGHRNAVTGLTFQRNKHQLYSSSSDRTIKVWDLEAMGYVETLYGHQDAPLACDSFYKERCLTSGGRDGTLRLWKIQEESQLVFYGHTGSIDCVRYINDQYFVSGGEDGSVCVYTLMKKRPIAVVKHAHQSDGKKSRWITAVAALSSSDLLATGSSDGFIRLWRCGERYSTLTRLFEIPAEGFVNDLRFTEDGRYVIAALGQEHKLGRWWTLKEAKNQVLVIPLQSDE